MEEIGRGAEAIVTLEDGKVRKWRREKGYRVRELDERIRRERTVRESRIISEARRCGVPTPIIFDISGNELVMDYIEGPKLKDVIDETLAELVGELVGRLHRCGIVHGDLTTSNMILHDDRIYLIDFGLAFHDSSIESQGVDLHVFFQTLKSTQDEPLALIEAFKKGYFRIYSKADKVLNRESEIEARGRYL